MNFLKDNKIKLYIPILLLLFFHIGCKKDSTSPTTNNSINYDDYGYITGQIKSINWEINNTNKLGIWSEETSKTPNSDVYHIRFNSKKSPIKSPIDSKIEFEFQLNLTNIGQNKIYKIINTVDIPKDMSKDWMSFSFKSLIPQLQFTHVYTKNSTPLIVKIENIHKDPKSNTPTVIGSIKGNLVNKDNLLDSILIDLNFKSTHYNFGQ